VSGCGGRRGVGSATAAFEVATIKPSDPAAAGTPIGIAPGGIFQARNATAEEHDRNGLLTM